MTPAWWPGAAAGAAAAAWTVRHTTSPAVRSWTRPQAGRLRRAGLLQVRDSGDGDRVVVLLHGITANHLAWGGGYDRLAEDRRLVVPDLLGFGGSIETPGEGYSLDAHLDALDAMVADIGVDGRPMTIVGWSLGALIALHWAARRPETERTVGFCAPLYRTAEEAAGHIRAMGMLERLFALDSPLAERTCRMMCRYRTQAQWLSVAISPQWPVAIARNAVKHTWPSYVGAMNGIIHDPSWADALRSLDQRGVPVVFADGAHDPVPVVGLTDALADAYGGVTTRQHPDARHDLPVAHPDWCRSLL